MAGISSPRTASSRIAPAEAPPPRVDPVGVGPNGTLTTKNPRDRNKDSNNPTSKMECDADRMRLASIDDERFLRDIINDANRTNTTFYPIDPRGLVALETGGGSAIPLDADQKLRRTHLESIRTLADGTDGIAVVDTNDLDKGLKKISDDLTSYYLLGYYSTNTKLDGGYRALEGEGDAARGRTSARGAAIAPRAPRKWPRHAPRRRRRRSTSATPVQAALGMLGSIRPESRIRLRATTVPGTNTLWVTGEVSPDTGRPDEWSQGGTADLQVTAGGATAGARVTLKPGDRTFVTSIALPAAPAATVDVQARVTPAAGGPAATDTIHVTSARAAAVLPPRPDDRQPPGAHSGRAIHARGSRAPRTAGCGRREASRRPDAGSQRAAARRAGHAG